MKNQPDYVSKWIIGPIFILLLMVCLENGMCRIWHASDTFDATKLTFD